jgi:hypothetical protein
MDSTLQFTVWFEWPPPQPQRASPAIDDLRRSV